MNKSRAVISFKNRIASEIRPEWATSSKMRKPPGYRKKFTIVFYHPDIEFHNNRAERQLRPMVITRKISFGSNTESGALRHCVLNSIVQTCKMQDIEPAEFLRRAYLSNGLDVPEIRANSPPAA